MPTPNGLGQMPHSQWEFHPANTPGVFIVTSASQFVISGLLFDGASFTTLVPDGQQARRPSKGTWNFPHDVCVDFERGRPPCRQEELTGCAQFLFPLLRIHDRQRKYSLDSRLTQGEKGTWRYLGQQ